MRWRGPLLAVVAMAACVALRFEGTALEYLPLDSWMYASMADDPRVYTATPWGYRLLGPLLVSVAPNVRDGFAALMAASLCGAAAALFLFLRALGHGERAALVGVLVFGVTDPVATAVRNPYLCEPLTAFFACAFLAALAARAPLGVLALVAVLGAFSKEIFLGLLPLVFLVRRPQRGVRRALVDAALVATPALVLTALLRVAWTPQFPAVWGLPGQRVLPVLWERLGTGLLDPELLLLGLTPLALIGVFTARGKELRTTWAPMALVYFLLPFAAWLYDPRPGRLPFFGETLHRLWIYAVPLMIPLALALWPRATPAGSAPAPLPAWPRSAGLAGWVGAALIASLPLWALDDYRRGPLPERFNGPVVRALFGESLHVARAMGRGDTLRYDLEAELPGRATRRAAQRFFLRGGWGPFPYLEPGPAQLEQPSGEISVPAGSSRPLFLQLTLSAPFPTPVRLERAGVEVARFEVAERQAFGVWLEDLVRGDNAVRVVAAPGLRLHAYELQPR